MTQFFFFLMRTPLSSVPSLLDQINQNSNEKFPSYLLLTIIGTNDNSH